MIGAVTQNCIGQRVATNLASRLACCCATSDLTHEALGDCSMCSSVRQVPAYGKRCRAHAKATLFCRTPASSKHSVAGQLCQNTSFSVVKQIASAHTTVSQLLQQTTSNWNSEVAHFIWRAASALKAELEQQNTESPSSPWTTIQENVTDLASKVGALVVLVVLLGEMSWQ